MLQVVHETQRNQKVNYVLGEGGLMNIATIYSVPNETHSGCWH